MNILIYDDNKDDIKYLIKCLNIFFDTKDYDYKIHICENLVYLFDNLYNFDLIFLDTEIDGENGIDIGVKIRELNKDMRIITSSYTKYLIDGYKLQAERYFIKPIRQTEFNIEFENILQNHFEENEGYYDEKVCNYKIYFKDILYIEFLERKTHIHFLNEKIVSTSYPLYFWEEKLKTRKFGKPHRAFIVNFKHISAFSGNDIILINEEAIPISRHFKKEFNAGYMSYLHTSL